MYGLTSQDPEGVAKDLPGFGLKNTQVVADPSNEAVRYLQDKYLPNLRFEPAKAAYPNGMVQPAELVFVGTKPVLAWTKEPKTTNMYGAVGRLDATMVHQHVVKAIEDAELPCSDGSDMMKSTRCVIL